MQLFIVLNHSLTASLGWTLYQITSMAKLFGERNMHLRTANPSDLRVIDQDGAILSRRASERSVRFAAYVPFSVQND